METHSRFASRASLAACAWLALLASGACTKQTPPAGKAPTEAAGEAAGAVAAAEAASPTAAGAGAADPARAALARAYPVLRCALTGSAVADEGLWKQHGFAGASAFSAAWSKAAAADPAWARGVVGTALRTPCANAPATAPAAPTPSAAPEAAAP